MSPSCPLCPPKADIHEPTWDVRFVPIPDITRIFTSCTIDGRISALRCALSAAARLSTDPTASCWNFDLENLDLHQWFRGPIGCIGLGVGFDAWSASEACRFRDGPNCQPVHR